ncbi:helix-turn-helix transcriptional regulator [Streptomyces sp. NPDC052101]|uniref:helix-turn-helix transcriptional regulator n=1 Tax=Streptomyces sp. NPDC052101 TaxID=3155763 RepID=UPI0034224F69
MQGDQVTPESALVELQRWLRDSAALAGLSRTQLASRSGIARTTVYEALRAGGPAPSERTVAALAKVLKLPVDDLLELQRRVVTPVGPQVADGLGLGRALSLWDPHDLEVHPADAGTGGEGSSVRHRRVLSGYVEREHDRVLADAVQEVTAGRSAMVVLVGTSSTGKTRACWEAVQPLAGLGWRLWHPFDPTRAEAALEDLQRVGPRTVVWLNEAQHYLGGPPGRRAHCGRCA